MPNESGNHRGLYVPDFQGKTCVERNMPEMVTSMGLSMTWEVQTLGQLCLERQH